MNSIAMFTKPASVIATMTSILLKLKIRRASSSVVGTMRPWVRPECK